MLQHRKDSIIVPIYKMGDKLTLIITGEYRYYK